MDSKKPIHRYRALHNYQSLVKDNIYKVIPINNKKDWSIRGDFSDGYQTKIFKRKEIKKVLSQE